MINRMEFINYLLDDINNEEEKLEISEIAKYFNTTEQEVLTRLDGLDLLWAVKNNMLTYTNDLKGYLLDVQRIYKKHGL